MEAKHNLLFDTFLATGSQQAFDLLLKYATSAKPIIDSYDFQVKDTLSQKERLKKLSPNYLHTLFIQQVGVALFYKEAGFFEEAAYSYDRSAHLSQGFATRAFDKELFKEWTQRKLCLRLDAAKLFKKIHRDEDCSYSYLYAAEAAEDLGDIALSTFYARQGSLYFQRTNSRPKNHVLNELFEDYS